MADIELDFLYACNTLDEVLAVITAPTVETASDDGEDDTGGDVDTDIGASED